MKEKKFLVIVIIVLVIFNGFMLIRFSQLKQKNTWDRTNSRNQGNKQGDELSTYRMNFEANIINSSSYLGNIVVRDSSGNDITIRDIFGNREKILVCRFSHKHCESCILNSIDILQQWVSSIGAYDVVFLGSHPNNRLFAKTITHYGIQGKQVYNAPEFNIPAEEIGHPYYFVLDSNMHISALFFPDKATPEITHKFLENIARNFN